MSRSNQHEWTHRTEDGCKRRVRALLFGGRWTLKEKLDSAPEWTTFDEPPLEDLLELHDLLHRKYRRGKGAWEHVTELEALIRSRGGSLSTDSN